MVAATVLAIEQARGIVSLLIKVEKECKVAQVQIKRDKILFFKGGELQIEREKEIRR